MFNAGGLGHDEKGVPSGPNRVADRMQINRIGHIPLLDTLKANRRCFFVLNDLVKLCDNDDQNIGQQNHHHQHEE
jgi:hypothetical protein